MSPKVVSHITENYNPEICLQKVSDKQSCMEQKKLFANSKLRNFFRKKNTKAIYY